MLRSRDQTDKPVGLWRQQQWEVDLSFLDKKKKQSEVEKIVATADTDRLLEWY